MAADVTRILQDALQLPLEARAELIDSLIQSLNAEVDPDAEKAWAEEIRRRLADIDSAAVQLVPWSSARKAILGH